TGAPIAAEVVAELAAARPELTVVFDQSFLSLSDRHADADLRLPANVFCVRSLTKDHAIPGVRVGYMIVPRGAAREIERSRPAWPTSAAAQTAAVAACRERTFVEDSRLKLAADRDQLVASLRALGLDPVPSSAPFLLARVRKVSGLRRRLLARHRVLV